MHPGILLPTWIRDSIVKLSLIICSLILLNHLLKMLLQVILLLVYLITFHSFSIWLIFFLIIIPTRGMWSIWLGRFNKNSFFDDFNLTNWNSVMGIGKNDVNISFSNYLSKVNFLIMSHVPMKKLNKQYKTLVYYSYTKLHP